MAGLRYLIQALLALGALALGPNMLETPEETWEQILAGLVALVLIGLAYHGIVQFVNSRRPKRFPDSIIAPKAPPKKEDL
ncbi:MAG TPA: hypothetical protein VMT02_05225 [Burkholderiales bacterium]|jgi:hypothetical protein|nr:hypothetical protein [Burkholderiales bacterium]